MDDLYVLGGGRLVMLDHHIYIISLFFKMFAFQMIVSVVLALVCKPAESHSDIDPLPILGRASA
jgi:hypothetical protein